MNTNKQNYTKDYSLLRKFDSTEAKIGDKFIWGTTTECEFLGVSEHNYIRAEHKHGLYYVNHDKAYEKPLGWVEGNPVYKGDTLYVKEGMHGGLQVSIVDLEPNVQYLTVAFGKVDVAKVEISALTWNKPKVKREGWLNIYKNGTTYLHDTEEEAAKGSVNFCGQCSPDFVTTIRIEWEE